MSHPDTSENLPIASGPTPWMAALEQVRGLIITARIAMLQDDIGDDLERARQGAVEETLGAAACLMDGVLNDAAARLIGGEK